MKNDILDGIKYYFKHKFKGEFLSFIGFVTLWFICAPLVGLSEGHDPFLFVNIPTNWVMIICCCMEIVFVILMVCSIKKNRKKRVVGIVFKYTVVFWIFISLSYGVLEGLHKQADFLSLARGRLFPYKGKFIETLRSTPAQSEIHLVGMSEVQLFHWTASFLPILLLFLYNSIYLVLFRKFEYYDEKMERDVETIKFKFMKLFSEHEYEKKFSSIYQTYLKRGDEKFLANYVRMSFDEFRFIMFRSNTEIVQMNNQMIEEFNYLNKFFNSNIIPRIKANSLGHFFVMIEHYFREYGKYFDCFDTPLIVTDKFCDIPIGADCLFSIEFEKCKLVNSCGWCCKDDANNKLGDFMVMFYGDSAEHENDSVCGEMDHVSKIKYVIVAFKAIEEMAIFANIAYLLYKNDENEISVVQFKANFDLGSLENGDFCNFRIIEEEKLRETFKKMKPI